MTDVQIALTVAVFVLVIAAIALDVVDMALAALVGNCLLVLLGVLTERDVVDALHGAGGPLALLFGGMVIARMLAKTGIFDRIGAVVLRATGGSGRRFLLLIVMMVAPVCAVLPNATTVILLAPVIIGVARSLNVDFVGPMIIAAVVSNSAGLLTLVGDPATFLVGSSIGMTFGQFLQLVSPAGLLAVLAVIPLLPVLLPETWRTRAVLPPPTALPRVERPLFVACALAVLALMVALFLLGDDPAIALGPPAVSIFAATLAFITVYGARVEPIDHVFRDIDWKTLVFLAAMFCIVQALIKTGLLQGFSLVLHGWFGVEFALVAMAMLAGVGFLSALLANIPVVAAALVMTKGYLVAAEAVPDVALAPGFVAWPAATLPIFIAMMFGGTLGGNATVIGASANIVSVGICASHGRTVTFAGFLRYGFPIALTQIAVSAAYVALAF